MAEPLASIIIPARDEEQNLRRCLTAVAAQKADFAYEVIVVDSGSRDRTAAVASEFGARVITIRRDQFQHGRTRQMASELARGEFVVYLVADAEPADERWLAALVAATASDDRIAGAYSRQVPRTGAGPVEALKLRHRPSSGETRAIREAGIDFWSLKPLERLWRCEFDDVSCCRRRAALDAIPIPAVDWAEDLLWAKEALLQGWRIVFEPASVVRHSHPDTIRHAFHRGWLDQDVARRGFGVVYWQNVSSALLGWPLLYLDQARAILDAGLSPVAAAKMLGWNALRVGSEILGNWAAAADVTAESTVDLLPTLARGPLARRCRGQVLRTSFTLGEDTRPTLFMNPNAAANAKARVPAGGRLRFGVGLNPLARRHAPGPVRFVAAVNGEVVFDRELSAGATERPAWVEADVDLGRWGGSIASFVFLTRAERTDYAWAGWAAPRLVAPGRGSESFVNRLRRRAEREVRGEPLRHP